MNRSSRSGNGNQTVYDLRQERISALVSWSLTVLYMGAIFFFSAQPNPSLPDRISGGGFLLHLIEYGILGLLLSWALANSGVERRLILYVFFVGLLYGAMDEFHQYFVPERNASLLDVSADGLGCLIGAYCFHASFEGVSS